METMTRDAAAAASKPAKKTFDRTLDDMGNIVNLEHVNLTIGDQQTATAFYVLALGLTRDPYQRMGLDNMGINIGRGQLHLPTAGVQRMTGSRNDIRLPAQYLRATIGLVLPSLEELAQRLEKTRPLLQGTQYSYKIHPGHVDVTCPWGNRIRCHAPSAEFGSADLALAYLEFDVPRGTAAGIADFYREALLAITRLEQRDGAAVACVDVGIAQKLCFRETDAPIPPFDGHHIQVYIANHSAPHRYLNERGLISEESNAHQYRFNDIVDPRTGKVLYTLEHEVRSMKHPSFNRPLVNRNTRQTNNNAERGHDAFRGSFNAL